MTDELGKLIVDPPGKEGMKEREEETEGNEENESQSVSQPVNQPVKYMDYEVSMIGNHSFAF